MGGSISVESTPGVGSKFSFEVTLGLEKPDETANGVYALHLDERPVFNGEILLCEDNEMNRLVASEFLAKIGLKTFIAENGRIGVDFVAKRHENKGADDYRQFDLILMDIHMPEMDGLDATLLIKEIDPQIPVIAMTANIMPEDVDTYIKSGMIDCISKPFVLQDLWSCLLKYLTPVSWVSD